MVLDTFDELINILVFLFMLKVIYCVSIESSWHGGMHSGNAAR